MQFHLSSQSLQLHVHMRRAWPTIEYNHRGHDAG